MAHLIQQACFLTAPKDIGTVVPCFTRALYLRGPVRSARLHISALGMYQAAIDGARVGKHCLVGAGALVVVAAGGLALAKVKRTKSAGKTRCQACLPLSTDGTVPK